MTTAPAEDPDDRQVPLNGDNDPARVLARRTEAMSLRLQGMTWQQIADHVGYASSGAAYTAVMPHLRRVNAETRQELSDITNARLERIMVALWPAAIRGDVKAAAEYRRYLADYRRHNGLDAPIQINMTGDAAKALLVERLLALREQRLAELEATGEGNTIPGELVVTRSDPALDDPLNHG